MNILLVSECTGNAIKETQRILDQFSERRGARTWQTAITYAGLETLHRLLRKTARKNTAVACYWIRGIDHSELQWIVGATDRFNAQGRVPTNETTRNILRSKDENDWHTLRQISLLSALAALWHDLGKACDEFQTRLRQITIPPRNLLRHEWISLRIFQAFIGKGSDQDWLDQLARQDIVASKTLLQCVQADGLTATSPRPFHTLPPLARAVGWLIVTHHRLPQLPNESAQGFQAAMLEDIPGNITAEWNERVDLSDAKALKGYWQFKHGLPMDQPAWRERAAKHARRLLELPADQLAHSLDNPYVMHLSRLALTLADHEYSSRESSEDRNSRKSESLLYANTDRQSRQLNQSLEEHLLGVEKCCGEIAYALPRLAEELPRLARHRGLRQRTAVERFRWQNKAADLAEGIRERAAAQGAFLVNMASTGCGKTLGNARILHALADPAKGMRGVFALGLRTLTLQTGREYRERLHLGEDVVAIRVGGGAIWELLDHQAHQGQEDSGSESAQRLLPEDGQVFFEGTADAHPVLRRMLNEPNSRALLTAPLLTCTIDHLVPATESLRGGHQILPMLRLLSSDLVLDELDDYGIEDLPAVARLIHWAGMLGSRVLISSATLPPALVQGMFEAYREGRQVFQRNRGQRPGEAPDICCVWIDEFQAIARDCTTLDAFAQAHIAFATKRGDRIGRAPAIRRAAVLPVSIACGQTKQIRQEYARVILGGVLQLHGWHHMPDPVSGARVSFGLVRMANIGPLREVAQALYQHELPEKVRIHLCVYHSQYPLLMRSGIEQLLDKALQRKDPLAVFKLSDVRQRLDANPACEHIFLVLGSPVTEVGRDHDYDWAVVEPSSMRSLIQLAGRILRHRLLLCTSPNILILSRNVRSLEKPGEPAFQKPGFETAHGFALRSHALEELLQPEQYAIIDARPRILAPEVLRPAESLVDLEHARLARLMQQPAVPVLTPREQRAGGKAVASVGAYSWWRQPRGMLTGLLQREQPFRKQTIPEVELVLLPNEDEDDWVLHEINEERGQQSYVPQGRLLSRLELASSPQVQPWGQVDYLTALKELAELLDMPLEVCAKKFGTVTLPKLKSDGTYSFHPALGFGVDKQNARL